MVVVSHCEHSEHKMIVFYSQRSKGEECQRGHHP